MSEIVLIVIIFIIPFSLAVYIWCDAKPKQAVYYICFSILALALIIILLAKDIYAALMPIGLFLVSTSFFAGVYAFVIIRKMRGKDHNPTANDLS